MNNTKDYTNNNKTKPEMEIKMMENEEEMNHVKNPLHNEDINTANNTNTTTSPKETMEENDAIKKKKLKHKKRRIRKGQSVIDAEQGNNIKVTICTHLGIEGILLLLLQFAYAGFYFYLMYEYSFYFKNMNRSSVWVFMFALIFYLILALYFTFRWCKIAKKDHFIAKGPDLGRRRKNNVPPIMQLIKKLRSKLSINGQYYLYKLYGFEITESINQIVNLFEIYTCSLPVGLTVVMCLIFFFDCCYRVYVIQKVTFTSRVRDMIVLVDICIDVLCMILPLGYLWFNKYQVPIAASAICLIVIWPSFCSLSKLRSIFRQVIRRKTHAQVIAKQQEVSRRISRQRQSLFGKDKLEELTSKQKENVPKIVHNIYSVYFMTMISRFICRHYILGLGIDLYL